MRDSTPALIRALHDPTAYDHAVDSVEMIETHISWVLLTGPFAYKIKKPVRFGFLDFSTPDLRRRYCEEEIRLNRRYAPQIYLACVPITGDASEPRMGGSGTAFEHAVKMRQFPQRALLARVARDHGLAPSHIDSMAHRIGEFHLRADRSPPGPAPGSAATIGRWTRGNFEEVRSRLPSPDLAPVLDAVERWSLRENEALRETFEARRSNGFVRECHGDLHLGNMAWLDDTVVPFDCIEFSEQLRWIDVLSEAAFVGMDLRRRGLESESHRFLDRYLAMTGDYGGLVVLRYYLTYRAMVRAKVALLSADPVDERAGREFAAALDLARTYTGERRRGVVLTHGASGSGKSTAASAVVEALGAIRVRSDVERKRLHGLRSDVRTGSPPGGGIYSAESNLRTYDRLAEIAETVVASDRIVVVDAAFLRRDERRRFRALARRLNAPFALLSCAAPDSVLRDRLRRRAVSGGDPSEADTAVLDLQLSTIEPLSEDETGSALTVDASTPIDTAALVAGLAALLDT